MNRTSFGESARVPARAGRPAVLRRRVASALAAALFLLPGCADDTSQGPVIPPGDTVAPAGIGDLAVSGLTPECGLVITWTSTGDDTTSGQAASYDIRYAAGPITADTWTAAAALPSAPAPGAAGTREELALDGLDLGTAHYLAIRARDEAGNESAISNVIELVAPPPPAHTWLVPCGAPTIQAGIDSAAAGDTVIVAPGTWNERIVMKSGVTVRSRSGADSTVIDGALAADEDGAVVRFDGVSDAVLDGFTIRGGSGVLPGGGGIRVTASAGCVIRSNVITANRSEGTGGGICISGSEALLMWNVVERDSAMSHGGGIAIVDGASAVVDSNRIAFNTNLTLDTGGGGIYIDDTSYGDIRWNAIVRNVGGEFHGGGGILCRAGSTLIENNTIVNNGFRTPLSGGRPGDPRGILHGPGAGVRLDLSGAVLRNNIIGQVSLVPHDYGTAIHSQESDPTIEYNLVWNSLSVSLFPPYSGIEDQTGVNGNIWTDPLLCDPDGLDFAPSAGSPCLTASASGGLIGALGPGCGLLDFPRGGRR